MVGAARSESSPHQGGAVQETVWPLPGRNTPIGRVGERTRDTGRSIGKTGVSFSLPLELPGENLAISHVQGCGRAGSPCPPEPVMPKGVAGNVRTHFPQIPADLHPHLP